MTFVESLNVLKCEANNIYFNIPKSCRRKRIDDCRENYEAVIGYLMEDYGYYYHHTAIHPRGIRKRNPVSAEVKPYEGRFGTGYTVHRYKEGSDNSHYVDYWIKEET